MQRLSSGSLDEVLDQVAPAIVAGAVNVISVEAIRARSGDRWARKREQVETFVERTFSRVAQTGDLIVALNDAEFLIVQPNATRTAALGVSANLLKDTLQFFLGAAAREDLRLFLVTSFVNGELAVQVVEPARVFEASEATPDGPARGAPVSPPSEDIALDRPTRITLTAPSGNALDLCITAEPTWNVAGRVVASHVLRPEVSLVRPDESPRLMRRAELSPILAGEIALATLQHAVGLLTDGGVRIGIHVPMAMSAITYSTSRYRLLHALRGLQPGLQRSIILEVTDLAEGLPQSRLAELVSTVAPYCRAVLARAPSEAMDVSAWRRSGVGGVTLDCSHLDPTDRNAQFRLSRFARGALEVSKSCVGYNLRSRSLLLAAWSAGFTHLNGPAISAAGAFQGPARLYPHDLFAQERRGAA